MDRVSSKSLPLKISCIVNPQAANRKWVRRKRIRQFLKNKFRSGIINFKESKEQTIELAKKLSQDHNILVAVGGDGTIADVIQGVIDAGKQKDVIVGILPLGSGNAFRKSLRIPKNVRKALQVISDAHTRKIDLISIEGKVAGFASIGATARVTQEKLKRKIPGLFGHLWAGRIILALAKKEMEIDLFNGYDDGGESFEEKKLTLRLWDCVIGKTNYFGYSWRIAPLAKIDDSLLDITLFETSRIKYLLFFPFIYLGLYQRSQKHFKARKMIIRGNRLPVQYNGEFLAEKEEVQVKVLPQVLDVIASKKIKGE
jgi:diacylglycerol kinase family enzyme